MVILRVMGAEWAIVSHGAVADRWSWSGIPASLTSAFRARGEDARRVSADLPAVDNLATRVVRHLPGNPRWGYDDLLMDAREFRLTRSSMLADAEVIVALGSRFGCFKRRSGVLLTYEDMTVAQAPLQRDGSWKRWIERQKTLYDAADVCCVTTPWAADSLRAEYNVPDRKIAVVGIGPNVSCNRVTKDWNTPQILWVGVDWKRKGGDLLLEAFRRAQIPNASLTLVGQHPTVCEPGVRGLGVIRDEAKLRTLFEEATLFVLPSRFDPSPIVLLEAASAGTPLVGSQICGLPYNVGDAGVVVPPNDIESLTSALLRMTRPEVAVAYSARAIEHARRRSWDAVAGKMIAAVHERTIAA